MSTSELVERLKHLDADAADLRAAALRLDELERENARLRAALEPFAQIAIQAEQAWTSGQYYAPEDYVRPAVRLKHFTAARAALTPEPGSET